VTLIESFPGVLYSNDDFYITSAGLVVMETTNDVINMSIYRGHITPQSMMVWVRAILANRMTSRGSDWTSVMGLYNSGTYNNQVPSIMCCTVTDSKASGLLWTTSFGRRG
jgi:hypothetical protein